MSQPRPACNSPQGRDNFSESGSLTSQSVKERDPTKLNDWIARCL